MIKSKKNDSGKILELYLGNTGLEVAKRYSSSNDKCVLGLMDQMSIDYCHSQRIPFIDVWFNSGLDGDYDWESRIEEYSTKEEEIVQIIEKYEKVLLICGLGGGTGSSLYIYLSNLCKKLKIKCDAIVTIPFDFEGYRRIYYSTKALNMGLSDNVIPIDLAYLKNKIKKETSMLDVFKYIDYLLCECIKYYEENDSDSNEVGVNYYSQIINNLDEKWIEQIREKIKEEKEI